MDQVPQRNYRDIEAYPIAGGLGAEINGLDLTQILAPEMVAEIHQAFLDYLVIFFCDQQLTPGDQLAFAQQFGQPMP